MKSANTKLWLMAALLPLAACGSADAPIRDTEWRVESVGTTTQPFADGLATVAFSDEGRVSAYAGCNRMGGSYTVDGQQLAISQMMSTRMACFPQQKLIDEQALADALSKATRVSVKQDKATLSGADGVVAVLWRVQ